MTEEVTFEVDGIEFFRNANICACGHAFIQCRAVGVMGRISGFVAECVRCRRASKNKASPQQALAYWNNMIPPKGLVDFIGDIAEGLEDA